MEVVVLLETFPFKDLAQKGQKCNGGKKSKQKMTVYFFVSAKGGKVDKPILIWKSRKPRYFKRINAAQILSKFLILKTESHGCILM